MGKMKYPEEVLREWIEVLAYEPKRPLSKWEEDFLASVSDQLTYNRHLSDAQIDKLEQIYADKT